MEIDGAEIGADDAVNSENMFSEDFSADFVERWESEYFLLAKGKNRGFTIQCMVQYNVIAIRLIDFNTHSGWNNETSPQQQQSPSSNQQIPPGMDTLPQQPQQLQQQQQNNGRGGFRGNSRGNFAGRGRGRGGVNPNWNPHMQGQPQGQPQPLAGPMGIIQNAPPNMNQPPPKMVRLQSSARVQQCRYSNVLPRRNCGSKRKLPTRSRITTTQSLVKPPGRNQKAPTSKSWRSPSLKLTISNKWGQLIKNQITLIQLKWGKSYSYADAVSRLINRLPVSVWLLRVYSIHHSKSPANCHSFHHSMLAYRHSLCITRHLSVVHLRGTTGKLTPRTIRRNCLMIAKLIPKF